jgi:hypothetical protein
MLIVHASLDLGLARYLTIADLALRHVATHLANAMHTWLDSSHAMTRHVSDGTCATSMARCS